MNFSNLRRVLKPKVLIAKIRRKGLFGAIRVGVSWAMDVGYDRSTGASTADWVKTAEIDTTSINKAHGVLYQPSKVGPLRKALKALSLPLEHTFIDFGVVKGECS